MTERQDPGERAAGLAAAWAEMSAEEHILMHLGHTMMSLYELPPYAADDGPPLDVAVVMACREALFLHGRTVAEFFVRMPRKDWTARDFLQDWIPPTPLADRLDGVWLIASKHIAHMSKERVPDPATFELEDVSLAALTAIARDCHCMLAAFVRDYRRSQEGRYAEQFAGYLRGPVVERWVREWIVFPPVKRSPRWEFVVVHAQELIDVGAELGATGVALCGSVARGDDGHDSDIDIYIGHFDSIDEGGPEDRLRADELVRRFRAVLAPYAVDVRPLPGWFLSPAHHDSMEADAIPLERLLGLRPASPEGSG